VDAPSVGFVFPAFIDRSSDVNSVMYYTKNAKKPHPEFMEKALGCPPRQTATLQKENFQTIIKKSIPSDQADPDKIFMEIQDNLNAIVEEHNALYEDPDSEPITLTNKDIQEILIETGVPEEVTTQIEKSYEQIFGEDLPLASHLIDQKTLKESAQRKKEAHLEKQVEVLQSKLQQVTQEAPDSPYDIVLQVNPEKVPQIKTQIIDGKKCLIIPMDENEQARVNGSSDILSVEDN
jgi:anti-sigma28 factor (negative regulator of flagellin synthesis)